jgi:hypothetical protein
VPTLTLTSLSTFAAPAEAWLGAGGGATVGVDVSSPPPASCTRLGDDCVDGAAGMSASGALGPREVAPLVAVG